MKSDSRIAIRTFLNRMWHGRNHRRRQAHAIEFHHCTFFHESFHFENLRCMRGSFEGSNGQRILSIWLIQSRRINLHGFAAVSWKNLIVHRCGIATRSIENEIRIEARLLFFFPFDIIGLSKDGSSFQTDEVISALRSFKLIKSIVKGSVCSTKNSCRCFLKIGR